MRHRKFSLFGLVSGLYLLPLLLLCSPAASAAATPGITVSPGRLQFLLPGKTGSQTLPITLTNGYSSDINLTAQFAGIDENAGLLVPTGLPDATFAKALAVSQTDFTIPAGSSLQLTVQATNLASLAPGGHYATLVLTQQSAAGKKLSLRAAISLSIFVIKPDGAKRDLSISQVSTNGSLFTMPTTVNMTFTNSGNVHAVPRASVILVSDDGAKLYAKGTANQTSLPVLPGGKLPLKVQLIRQQTPWLPQRLQLAVTYRADDTNDFHTVIGGEWYIPPIYLLPFGIIVTLLVWRRQRRSLRQTETASVAPPEPSQQIETTSQEDAVTVKIIPKTAQKKTTKTPPTKPKSTAKKKPASKPKKN